MFCIYVFTIDFVILIIFLLILFRMIKCTHRFLHFLRFIFFAREMIVFRNMTIHYREMKTNKDDFVKLSKFAS